MYEIYYKIQAAPQGINIRQTILEYREQENL